MQNAHVLSQPIWIVTQLAWSTSRRVGRAEGNASATLDSGTLTYDLNAISSYQDGVDLQINGPACHTPTSPSGVPVLYGEGLTEIPGSVNIVTGDSC